MRREIMEMERVISVWMKDNGYDEEHLPPEVQQLRRLLAATRGTLERLWLQSGNRH